MAFPRFGGQVQLEKSMVGRLGNSEASCVVTGEPLLVNFYGNNNEWQLIYWGMGRDGRPGREAEPVGVEKTCSWDQGEGHSLLAHALVPVAGKRTTGIKMFHLSTSHCTPVVLGIHQS